MLFILASISALDLAIFSALTRSRSYIDVTLYFLNPALISLNNFSSADIASLLAFAATALEYAPSGLARTLAVLFDVRTSLLYAYANLIADLAPNYPALVGLPHQL